MSNSYLPTFSQEPPSPINASTVASMAVFGTARNQILRGEIGRVSTIGLNCYPVSCHTCFKKILINIKITCDVIVLIHFYLNPQLHFKNDIAPVTHFSMAFLVLYSFIAYIYIWTLFLFRNLASSRFSERKKFMYLNCLTLAPGRASSLELQINLCFIWKKLTQ